MMWVFPSGDIHLVTASNMQVGIRVVVQVPAVRTGQWSDVSTVDHMLTGFPLLAGGDPGVAHTIAQLVGAHGADPAQAGPARAAMVSPSNVAGTSFHQVSTILGVPSTQTDFGVIRVTTHTDVTALFAGDHTLSAFAGESDRVVTVYAQFSDGKFEDVTGHPWLAYHAADEAITTVDNEGRIHAVAPGMTTIRVTTWDGRFAFNVPLTVRPAFTAGLGSAVVVDELSRRTARSQTTLFVLAEGYRDRARFFSHARPLVRALFQTRPFIRLSDRFHAVGVFQPSPDQGVTIGARLVPLPNRTADVRDLWTGPPTGLPQQHAPAARLFTRDTLFGLMSGARLASTPRVPKATAPPTAAATFFAPRAATQEFSPDDRRLPRFGIDTATTFTPTSPPAAFASTIRRYLAAAGHPVGPNDRVAFLIDDELYGGFKVDVLGVPLNELPMVAVSNRFSLVLHGVTGTGTVLDRAPSNGAFDAEPIGSRLAHELAHTYQLADEYENTRKRAYAGDPLEIEAFENIQHDSTLRVVGATSPLRGDTTVQPPLPPSQLDVVRIKWNIHRIAKLSPTKSITAVTGNNARLALDRGQARRWAVGEQAFVRNSLITLKPTPASPRTNVAVVTIAAVDPSHDTVDVTLPAGFALATLGAMPLLYVAKRNNAGNSIGLVDPAVLAYLTQHGPFPKPTACGVDDPRVQNNDQDAPDIPGFSRPSVKADAIGLYEGGGNTSCDVYRPSGRCKMRNPGDIDGSGKITFDGFCFVCQYVLVELNDPSKHEALDTDYPRDR